MKKIWAELSAKETLLFRLAFCVVLLVQLGMMLYFGVQKAGFHEDEMYTYLLSSYQYSFFSGNANNYEQWLGGAEIADALSAQGDERFNVSYVYQNQVKDVHPPLYYFVINVAMSLVPNVFSKWIGIVPNMIYSLLTSFVLYQCANRITKNKWQALCAAAFYALSVGAMSTAVFIRMYAMLTLWVVVALYYHLRAFDEFAQEGIRRKTFAGLFAFICCGLLTHYYFFVVCFFMCGGFCLFLLCQKACKALLQYAGVALAALGAAYLFFPAMLDHMFNGYRGEEALENLVGADNYIASLRNVLGIVSGDLLGGFALECMALFVGLFLVILLWQKVLPRFVHRADCTVQGGTEAPAPAASGRTAVLNKRATLLMGALLVLVVGYVGVVARIAAYQINRYYMCIYPLVSLLFVYVVYALFAALVRKRAVAVALLAVCCAVLCAVSHQVRSVDYLYQGATQRKELLTEYSQTPVVVVNCGYGDSFLSYIYELVLFDEVFFCQFDQFASLAVANADGALDDGFLLYMVNYDFTQEERLWLLDYYIGFSGCEALAEDVYYCTK